jgi:hypothetical protein
MSIGFLIFTWPSLTQPKLIQLGGAFVFKMKALNVLLFLVIGIVHAQWGLEEEMRECGYTTSTSTVIPLTTSQILLATTLPTTTTTARPITTPLVPNTTVSTVDPVVTMNTTTTILPPTTSARKTMTYRRLNHAHPCHQKFDYPLPDPDSIYIRPFNLAQPYYNNKPSHSHNNYTIHDTDDFLSSAEVFEYCTDHHFWVGIHFYTTT